MDNDIIYSFIYLRCGVVGAAVPSNLSLGLLKIMRVQKVYSDGCKISTAHFFFSNLKFNRKHSLFFNISVRVRFLFILRY